LAGGKSERVLALDSALIAAQTANTEKAHDIVGVRYIM
jgi:hypothetical protein